MTPMAQHLLLCVLDALLLALAFNLGAYNSSSNHHGLKSLHFTLYQQETINKTLYLIVKGVAGPEFSPSTSPFGSMFVNQDLLTVTPDSSSRVVGVAEGASITSRIDGLTNIVAEKITLDLGNLKGSLSILGTAHNIEVTDVPVVGGTGDFLFAQGYICPSTVSFHGPNIVYKLDFYLYWPPYANPSSLDDQNSDLTSYLEFSLP